MAKEVATVEVYIALTLDVKVATILFLNLNSLPFHLPLP